MPAHSALAFWEKIFLSADGGALEATQQLTLQRLNRNKVDARAFSFYLLGKNLIASGVALEATEQLTLKRLNCNKIDARAFSFSLFWKKFF